MMDMLPPSQCTLCGACVDRCPINAISFEKEYMGGRYPQIDLERCVECGLCVKACPVRYPVKKVESQLQSYAAINRNDVVRSQSSSGGIFSALAEAILAENGYVCGAILTEELSVVHEITNNAQQLQRMRGSKYVQSKMSGIFRRVEQLLQEGKSVLFTGCPCQAAALRTYLGREYETLYVVDVICHGMPIQSSWETYIARQEHRHKSKVQSVSFRDKKDGWHNSGMCLTFANGKKYHEPITADGYFRGYFGNVTLKACCYDCAFRSGKSGADISLGDFWGAETTLPDMDDNKGVSAVLVRTKKGASLFDKISLEKRSVPYEHILIGNRHLEESPLMSPKRAQYYNCKEISGEDVAMEKYLMESFTQKYWRKFRHVLRKIKHTMTGEKTLY